MKLQVRPLLQLALAALLAACTSVYGADPPAAAPGEAKICLNCHKPQPNNLRGHWESVAMKSSTVQLKIDSSSQVLKFDRKGLKVLNVPDTGDLEKMLKGIKKGHEVRIEFIERDGGRFATVIAAKPPVKLPAEERVSLAEMEQLIALGPDKGGYSLFDSRPAARFREGAIPGAVSLPFPEFDKLADRLPADKSRLVIFYCSGATCNMSPGSHKKAKLLGYKNAKVFVEGMPGWLGKNHGVLTAASFKEAYGEIPHILLDARPAGEAARGFIKGAVAVPATDEVLLKLLPKKEPKAPIIVYDGSGEGRAARAAAAMVKGGFGNVMVLSDGFAGARAAKLPVETGTPATTVTYVPRPKPGEFPMADFQKLVDAIPGDTVVVDVRNPEELKEGTIRGALNIPVDQIEQELEKIPAGKRVVTFCNTGTRAEMAYHAMKNRGVANVFFLNAKVDFDDGKPEISK